MIERPQSAAFEIGYSKAVEKLGPEYRSLIKSFEIKLMKGLGSPGLHIEPIEGCKAEGIRSARVNDDLRVVLLIDPLTLLYVDHHEHAYEWARRRQVTASGDGKMVTVYETARDDLAAPPRESGIRADLFCGYENDYLSDVIGVPREYIPPLRRLADASEILELVDKIPDVVVERLLDVAEGRLPELEVVVATAERSAIEELAVVGAVPLDESAQESLDLVAQSDRKQWIEFLGAKQKRLAQGAYERPVLLTGPAGTGKTVVLFQRAATLGRLGNRVLLAIIGRTLATSMKADLDVLAKGAPWRGNVDVRHFHDLVCELRDEARKVGVNVPEQRIVYGDPVERALKTAAEEVRGSDKKSDFWYLDEWNLILEPQAVTTLDQYLQVERPGRGTALQRAQREQEWPVFERAVELLGQLECTPLRYVVSPLLVAYSERRGGLPTWPCVLVDEAQDLGIAYVRLVLLLAEDPAGVFLAGDSSQRLHVPPLDVASLGIEFTKRRLTRSHRTTEAIRHFVEADLALRDKGDRSNGSRSGGPTPEVHQFDTDAAEFAWIATRCAEWASEGHDLADVGIALKDKASAERMFVQLERAGVPCHLVNAGDTEPAGVAVLNHHLAKGLEFNTVVVAQLTSDFLDPHNFDWMPDDQKAEKLAMRHNLIYVALTRARERLVVTCGGLLPERLRGHQFVTDHLTGPLSSGGRALATDAMCTDDIPF